MSTKMKGLFKGLRYISQVFDDEDEKEEEIQIGLPTDVKHVAHVGWDGPPTTAAADTPSWMKNSNPGDSHQSNKEDAEKHEIKEKRRQRTKKSEEKEHHTRRRSIDDTISTDTSPKKPSRRLSADNSVAAAAKPRPSRRSQSKDSSVDGGGGDAPKKTRRKKSEAAELGSRRPRNKAADGDGTTESESDTAAQKHSSHLSEND